jgi:spermidine/putrescine transport system ATP-binding protein
VYERPSSAFVAGFIGRNNFWKGVATDDGVIADDGTVFVVSKPDEQVARGEAALAAVRPENFVLATQDPGDGRNAIAGTVASVAHFGDTLQYVVRTGSRDVLVLTPRANAPRLSTGDDVWCTFTAADVYSFSARQADLVLAEPSAEPGS